MEDKKINFADYQARERAIAKARQYINIFHQLHVINAGLEALNREFLTLSDEVVNVLPDLSGGAKFYQHIKNLKDGSTPIDKIDADLLPFGKDVFYDKELLERYITYTSVKKQNQETEIKTTQNQISQSVIEPVSSPVSTVPQNDYTALFNLLREFKATPQSLEEFKSSEIIKDIGPNWKIEVKNIINLSTENDKIILSKSFDNLCIFDLALDVWKECIALVKNPKQKTKQEILSNLSNYKKYLGMFGQSGKDLYLKIENLSK